MPMSPDDRCGSCGHGRDMHRENGCIDEGPDGDDGDSCPCRAFNDLARLAELERLLAAKGAG